jgi:hypothetical protein
MATTVIDLLTRKKELQNAKADWQSRMEGLIYNSPLPPALKPPLHQLKNA